MVLQRRGSLDHFQIGLGERVERVGVAWMVLRRVRDVTSTWRIEGGNMIWDLLKSATMFNIEMSDGIL